MMTAEEQRNLLSSIGRFVKQEIAKATEPLRKRIAELETRGVSAFDPKRTSRCASLLAPVADVIRGRVVLDTFV